MTAKKPTTLEDSLSETVALLHEAIDQAQGWQQMAQDRTEQCQELLALAGRASDRALSLKARIEKSISIIITAASGKNVVDPVKTLDQVLRILLEEDYLPWLWSPIQGKPN